MGRLFRQILNWMRIRVCTEERTRVEVHGV